MTDTPIYDQLRAELLNADVPAGDNNAAPPEPPATQPVVGPQPSQRPTVDPLGEATPNQSLTDTKHYEGDTTDQRC